MWAPRSTSFSTLLKRMFTVSSSPFSFSPRAFGMSVAPSPIPPLSLVMVVMVVVTVVMVAIVSHFLSNN